MSRPPRIRFRHSLGGSLVTLIRTAVGGELRTASEGIDGGLDRVEVDPATFDREWLETSLPSERPAAPSSIIESLAGPVAAGTVGPAIDRHAADAVNAIASSQPKMAAQLPFRVAPLRGQWESYGVGLLRSIESAIWAGDAPSDWYPTHIDVWGLQPPAASKTPSKTIATHESTADRRPNNVTDANALFRGGTAGAETAWVPALLTNVDDGVPEWWRAGWLITRCVFSHHLRSRSTAAGLPREQLRRVSQRWDDAAAPLVVRAAAAIESRDRSDDLERLIQRAVGLWYSPRAAARVITGWNDVDPSRPLPPQFR